MSGRGVVELGDLYRLSRLVERHGAGFDLGQLGKVLVGECPGATADHWSERCNVHWPQLVELWRQGRHPSGPRQ